MNNKHIFLALLLAGIFVVSGCNLTTGQPTATSMPTATSTPAATPDTEPASSGSQAEVVGWYGLITSLPAGSQFDDYLFLLSEGAGSVGVAGLNSAIETQIANLRNTNIRAHLYGTITCNVPDYNGCQVTVSQLHRDDFAAAPPTFEVDGWTGRVYTLPTGSQYDDYFVLDGNFPIRYGINIAREDDPDGTLTQEFERNRDNGALLSINGHVICALSDVSGCQIRLASFTVLEPGATADSGTMQGATTDNGQTAPDDPQLTGTVSGWEGTITGNPPGSQWQQYDDYFELAGTDGSAGRYGIASHDAALAQQLIAMRDTGITVRITGTIWNPVADSYNRQIVVTGLEVVQQNIAPPVVTCDLPPRLTIGSAGRVALGPLPNAMRSAAGTESNSVVIGTIASGTIFTVLDGPICANGYNWWRVDASGFVGWTAEGQNTEYWLEPIACANAMQVRLVPGQQGRVTLTPDLPNRVRSTPSSSSEVIGQIPSGGIFSVLDGPHCGTEGWAWWRVNYNGLIGWTAEGDGNVYWLEPYNATTTEPVIDLHGTIVSLNVTEPSSGADDYLQGMDQNGTRYGIASTDPVIRQQIIDLRDTGTEVRIWGDLRRNVPDYNNVQINITQLIVVNPPPSECVLPPRLIAGFSAIVTPGLPNAVRTAPGTGSNSSVQGNIPGGTIFRVLDGPWCVEGYNWWQIAAPGITGWTAEGLPSEYWLEPLACGNGLPSRMVPGETARVTFDPPLANSVREQPDSESALLGEIPPGGVFTVLSGPQCGAEGKSWWRVNYNGLIGWTAEGEPGQYWLEPVS